MSQTTVTWVKRSRYNPLRQLTPEYLSRIIDAWNNGYLRDFALMADAIKHRDPIINVGLRKREKAVARHGFEVLTLEGLSERQKPRAAEHQAAIKYFFDHCTVCHVLEQDVSGGFRLLVEQMMAAQGDRYAVHEIVYQPSIDPETGKPQLTAEFNYVPPWFFEASTGKLRFIRQYFGSVFGEEMPDDGWLVTVGEGLLETLAPYFVIKHAALEAWASYSERFGTPGVHGKTSAAKDSPAWAAFVDAVAQFGQEWATVTSQDATIELIEAAAAAGNYPFEPLIERIDKAAATICRGADLSTISSGASGSGGQGRGASLQAEETDLLEQDDAEWISESLHKISRIIVQTLFGDERPLAYVQIIVPSKRNCRDDIAKLGFLVNSNVPVGVGFARKVFGVPPPTGADQLLHATTQQKKPAAPSALANSRESAHSMFALIGSSILPSSVRRVRSRRLTNEEADVINPTLDRIDAVKKAIAPEKFDEEIIKLSDSLPTLLADAERRMGGIAPTWRAVVGAALLDLLDVLPARR